MNPVVNVKMLEKLGQKIIEAWEDGLDSLLLKWNNVFFCFFLNKSPFFTSEIHL